MNATGPNELNRHRAEGLVAASTIDRLRQETRAAHSRLDQNFGLIERLSVPGQRGRLLARYHLLHWETETRIAPFLGGIADLDLSARRLSPLIAEGLRILAHRAFPETNGRLDVSTRAAAFGALYVLEGSTLGGRVILKELKRRGASLAGLGFLDPYGNNTAQRWRSFLAILEREVTSGEQQADAVKGALTTFAFAEWCLRNESTN